MDHLVVISIHVSYLLALVLFLAVAGGRYLLHGDKTVQMPPRMPRGKVQTWFYHPRDILGLAFFFCIYYLMALMSAVPAEGESTGEVSVAGLMISIVMQLFAPLLAFGIVSGRIQPVRWLGLAWKEWVQVLWIAPLAVFGMFGFTVLLYFTGYLEMMQALGVGQEQEAVTLFREGQNPGLLLFMGFAAVIVAPLCEEVIFRGYLYPVAKKYAGSFVAAICSALIFSAAHGNMAALVPLFVFGLLMVALYEYTGSIWAPIAVHMLFNGSTVAIQLLARYAEIPQTVVR